jgi:SAM-dependent methyltransferase
MVAEPSPLGGVDWTFDGGSALSSKPYTDAFYKARETSVLRSASALVPVVLEFVKPQSVCDVGCGDGTWLSVFKNHGVKEICGTDGDYVDRQMLKIPQELFIPADLSRPFKLERKFDLVMSLEVAEHLPPSSADSFVDSLARLGHLILFGAAIPFQGGRHHVNEQWQDYWVEKFEARGFLAIDCIRKRIWDNDDVQWWYAQNSFMFCHRDRLNDYPLLKAEHAQTHRAQLRLVHPRKYLTHADPRFMSLRRELGLLPTLIRGYLKRKTGA